MHLLKHLISETFGSTGVLCTFCDAVDKIGSSYTKKQHQLWNKKIAICEAQMVLLVLVIIAVFKFIGEKYGFLNLTPACWEEAYVETQWIPRCILSGSLHTRGGVCLSHSPWPVFNSGHGHSGTWKGYMVSVLCVNGLVAKIKSTHNFFFHVPCAYVCACMGTPAPKCAWLYLMHFCTETSAG